MLAASRVRREASLSERPATTDLRYLVLPAELRLASTAVFLVEADPSRVQDGKLAFVPASEETRQLGRDAHAVEYWLATPRDRYSPPPLAKHPEFEIFPEVVRELCATGRLHTGERRRERGRVAFEAAPEPLRWDDGEPWKLELELVAHEERRAKRAASYRLDGWLARGTERRPLSDARVLTQAGLAIFEGVAARFNPAGTFGIAGVLQGADSPVLVGDDELEAFVRDYYLASSPPALALPDGVRLDDAAVPFSPVLDLRPPEPGTSGVLANVWFEYDSVRSALAAPGDRVLDWPNRRLLVRDLDGERARIRELAELGFRGRALREEVRAIEPGEPVTIAAKKASERRSRAGCREAFASKPRGKRTASRARSRRTSRAASTGSSSTPRLRSRTRPCGSPPCSAPFENTNARSCSTTAASDSCRKSGCRVGAFSATSPA